MDIATRAPDWSAIERDARFQDLHRRKSRFLWGLMAFSVVFYFALPIGAAYFTDLFRTRLWGAINFGLVFALAEFVVAWTIAYVYSRKATQFDAMADAIIKDSQAPGRHA